MLQPRFSAVVCCWLSLLVLLVVVTLSSSSANAGHKPLNISARQRRQDNEDVTTVLLVDSNGGRSQFGRYVSVRPDHLGLLTSTARTFIQEGVTTEYATQVLGTTLDNGRLYAQLLTKSSRVFYDHDTISPTVRSVTNKASWVVDDNLINAQHVNVVRNTDYVQPDRVEPYVVFPTSRSDLYKYVENIPKEIVEDELLQSPSNNPRIPYHADNERKVFTVSSSSSSSSISNKNGNIKMFKIDPRTNRDHRINYALKDSSENDILRKDEAFGPSKVKEWDNLPTFTVRNEFAPSGYSFLGNIPEFNLNTERSKHVTAAERKAKLLFRAGLTPKPDLKTVTYTGFADFTTTVGDTVIVFSPQTSAVKPPPGGQVTKISVEATLRPSATLKERNLSTKLKTFLLHEPDMQTKTVEGHKINMHTQLPTMVIDASNRHGKSKGIDTSVDIVAKSKVLAHEQKISTPALSDMVVSSTVGRTIIFASDDQIEPSERQLPMLSTPSDEDIAKIFASLQAQQTQKSTQPLNTPSTIFFDDEPSSTTRQKPIKGTAKTIFFDEKPASTAVVQPQTTPKQETKITTNPPTTTEREITTHNVDTTENIPSTTTKEEPTTNEILTTSENGLSFTTPEESTNEIDAETDVKCTEGQQIIPTTAYRTLTYLTTFYIPVEKSTSTSVKSNKIISTEIGFETRACSLTPSTIDDTTIIPSAITTTTEQIPEQITTEDTTTDAVSTTEEITTQTKEDSTEPATGQETTIVAESTTMEITTERRHVTESEPETTELTTEDGEEVELVFKTLYTTYTYLTTYFQESTSSVASRKEVITNVITSTIDPSKASEDPTAGFNVKDSFKSKPVTFDDIAAIAPNKVPTVKPTAEAGIDDDDEDNELLDVTQPTPSLSDNQIKNTVNAAKTYYTTYTYFTTIFVDGETEISSRTEVYTNFVTIKSTAPIESILQTKAAEGANGINDEDDAEDSAELKSRLMSLHVAPRNSYNSTINRERATKVPNASDKAMNKNNNYSTLHRTTTDSSENELLDLSEYETISSMVTDVRSSTSQGERRVLESTENGNVLLDDQIVSESNNDSEILPSPTLLLQTSYTTFTYFTTMYQGTTSSNIVSRLETVTNVVTETLSPTHSLSAEDLNLPITYFTTFTYWTTLYKEGTTKVTSREETISNVVTPTATVMTPPASKSIQMSAIERDITISSDIENLTPSVVEDTTEEIKPTSVIEVEELTTYFTTYTYYTTSYVGNSTVLNSRLETVTNVVNKTEIETNQIGRAISNGEQNNIEDEEDVIKTTPISIEEAEESVDGTKSTGLLSTIISTVVNSGIKTVLSTDVYGTYIDGLYAKVLESTSSILTDTSSSIEPSSVTETLKPTGVVSINKGKIVDAEGISTLYYATQAVGTYIDNLYAQVIESTTSLNVDEEKKSSQALESSVAHKTGLVRFIEGSIEQNHTTTLYQSKVLGTVIDGRYAQIIESTSSFIVDTIAASKVSGVSGIAPTPTKAPDGIIKATDIPISPSPVVIEGSISDVTKLDSENTTEGDEEEEEEEEEEEVDEDGNTRIKSRLTFQSRKRTFTPVIRPFASRPRPSFAPKRKGSGVGSATTITRSDFTPTVTAVPASKSGSRFGGRRSSTLSSINLSTASSSGRRFQRPKSSSQLPTPSSSFAPSRRGSSRVQPTSTGGFSSSSRRSGYRSSSAGPTSSSIRPSSVFSANNRFRIRPTVNRGINANNITPPSTAPESDNDLTTLVTDSTVGEDEQETSPPTTTESSRRNQNPLLRFRRPPLSRPPAVTRTTTSKPVTGNNQATTRNTGRSSNRATTTSTTSAPTRTLYSRGGAQTRPRPGNSLFPKRNLFTTTTTTAAPEEGGDEDLENEEGGEDTDYEGSDTNSQTEKAPVSVSEANKSTTSKPYNGVQIRPFGALRRRTKRQVSYSRFRRPTGRTTTVTPIVVEEPETEPPKPSRTSKPRYTNRGRSRLDQSTTPTPRITPSRASLNQGRSQFTLRDSGTSNTRSNFRRPSTSSRRYSQTTPRSRARPLSSEASLNSRKTTTRPRSTRRRTTATRAGTSTEIESNYLVPGYDGTITVTHQIPTEVTIPVVNGKVTEYKNIITAKLSTEVLGPKQYTTSVSPFGKQVTLLLSHTTGYGANGDKIFTQFILNETPTTSVIFTPTYIRGRKTSFSHVIPSTAYVVEPVTSIITPNLANQAPLANILLSQLLLGNPIQQNPLLNAQNPGTPATPVTEFNTKTTTYVTTVTSETSTVLPITFRGKQILTTIIDTNINVFTATEFITDTIIVTPTPALQQNNQLNSLLVPLLLQQQQAAQQQQQPFLNPLFQSPAGVAQIPKHDSFFNQNLFQDQIKQNLADDEEVYVEEEDEQHDVTETAPKTAKLSRKKKNKQPTLVEQVKETSVITLYVSGRTPGEFSTVLSTVVVGEEIKKKREATYIVVEPSKAINDLVISTLEYVDSYLLPAMKDSFDLHAIRPTESLESIMGDVNKQIVTDVPNEVKPSKTKKYKLEYEKSTGAAKQSPDNFLAQ